MKDKCPKCGQPLEYRLQFHPDACCISFKAGIEEGKRQFIAQNAGMASQIKRLGGRNEGNQRGVFIKV